MPTPKQIEEQVNLERIQVTQGVNRLKKNTKQLEAKSYGSATVYGITSIDALMEPLVQHIKDTNGRIRKGQAGKNFREIREYLSELEPLAAAGIALKLTFDKVFSHKENSNHVTNVTASIGGAIEDECQMRYYERVAPGLLTTLKRNYWHQHKGTAQKLITIQTLMNKSDVKNWIPWGRSNRVSLGTWLLEAIMIQSGWFYKSMRQQGRKRVNYIYPTPEFLAIKDKVI